MISLTFYAIACGVSMLIIAALAGLAIYLHEKEDAPLFKDKKGGK